MNIEFYRESIRHHGVTATLYYAFYRAINRIIRIEVRNGIVLTLDQIDTKFLTDSKSAQGRMLDADSMRKYSENEANLLPMEFIDEAASNGDRCYAMFDGDVLISYGWYTTRPKRLTGAFSDLVLHFDPEYAYMYHGYTHVGYRGQRLHAIGMAAALQIYASEGSKGLVSDVDSTNFASLKSCYRMGYVKFGVAIVVKLGKRYLCRSTPGCRKYDFRVRPYEI